MVNPGAALILFKIMFPVNVWYDFRVEGFEELFSANTRGISGVIANTRGETCHVSDVICKKCGDRFIDKPFFTPRPSHIRDFWCIEHFPYWDRIDGGSINETETR